MGFKIINNYHFMDEYKPEGWNYEPIDVFDENKSIYPIELNGVGLLLAERRYKTGSPDVVYRKL